MVIVKSALRSSLGNESEIIEQSATFKPSTPPSEKVTHVAMQDFMLMQTNFQKKMESIAVSQAITNQIINAKIEKVATNLDNLRNDLADQQIVNAEIRTKISQLFKMHLRKLIYAGREKVASFSYPTSTPQRLLSLYHIDLPLPPDFPSDAGILIAAPHFTKNNVAQGPLLPSDVEDIANAIYAQTENQAQYISLFTHIFKQDPYLIFK